MSYFIKFGHLVAAIAIISISGCAQDLERLNNDLRSLNEGLSRQTQASATPGLSIARSAEPAQSQPTQLIYPKEKTVAAAMETAMPNITKVISLHRCMKSGESLRLLNFHAITGKDFKSEMYNGYGYPNSVAHTKYHDRNNCMAARTLDQWSMPALNALQFRAVYFAEDSGETVNFQYVFKRAEDGSWKIDSIQPNVR